MTSKAIYLGELRVESTHLQSGQVILSDAPTDNNGKGEAFSPTDLVATALATCLLTIMGIVAARHEWDIVGATAAITKTMASNPRRISKIEIVVHLAQKDLTEGNKKLLENAALTCPVGQSLHPDLEQDIQFVWS